MVGSLNQDLVIRVPRHPEPGETVLGTEHFTGMGGKGANQAVAAARLGARVAMIGCLGADAAGDEMMRGLDDAGVDTSHVRRSSEAMTGLAVISVDEHAENAIVVSPGANATLRASDVDAASAALAPADVTLAQLEVPLAAVGAAARLAGGLFVLNPAPAPLRPLRMELLDLVDVLVPNRSELASLAGSDGLDDVRSVVAAVVALPYTGTVVVTLGAAGALVVEGRDIVEITPPDVEPVDTTGAGDAFCGALAESLARGEPIEAAARWGVFAGAHAVTAIGAQPAMPTRDDVAALIKGAAPPPAAAG